MKTSSTNRHAATSHFAASRKVRGLAIACALFGALGVAQDAAAKCNPQVPRSCAQPEQAKPGQRYQAQSLHHSAVSYADKKPHSPTPIYKARAQGFQGPIGPGPRHDIDQSGAGKHGIIFVGGHSTRALDKAALNTQPIPPGHSLAHDKAAINSQPVPPGHEKQMLNPQPIPPGHSLRRLPHPGVPLEKIGH